MFQLNESMSDSIVLKVVLDYGISIAYFITSTQVFITNSSTVITATIPRAHLYDINSFIIYQKSHDVPQIYY